MLAAGEASEMAEAAVEVGREALADVYEIVGPAFIGIVVAMWAIGWVYRSVRGGGYGEPSQAPASSKWDSGTRRYYGL